MEWETIEPKVKPEAEFLEIATDFGDPFEIFREAISNSFDAKASFIRINIYTDDSSGKTKLIIEFTDNGKGMKLAELKENFWDLGNSTNTRKIEQQKIGEKGHGTKIYLRSDFVKVVTKGDEGSFESVCEKPYDSLIARQIHRPKIRRIDELEASGTFVQIIGYNFDERSRYYQSTIKDYILWFTKIGSIECEFKERPDFRVELKGIDADDYENIEFGHIFGTENDDLEHLFESFGTSAGDYFCKKYIKTDRLPSKPEIEYSLVIYVEGDQVKKAYNPLLRSKKVRDYYKVSDRYGLWLAKDFIPVQRVNEWVTGFGSGSNSYLLLHGFINCQKFKLTANRGSISNTEPDIVAEIKNIANNFIKEIDEDLTSKGLYTVSKWNDEEKTLEIEKAEYERRVQAIKSRKIAKYNNRLLLEPKNESEVFGLFTSIYAMQPNLFEFEPMDYNTTRGIDIIGRNKTDNVISDCEYWYIEMKYLLEKNFNHSFKYTRWIVCWDFANDIKHETTVRTNIENEERKIVYIPNEDTKIYFLEKPTDRIRIQVIRLREYLEKKLGIIFVDQENG
jgi:hypothetical protein